VTHIYDTAESPYGTGSILVLLPCHVLGQTAGHYDDVIGYLGHLLDGKVDQSPQSDITRLEELRHTKECLSCFSGG